MLVTAKPSFSVCFCLFSYNVLCELITVSEFCFVVYNHTAAQDGHSKSLDPHGQPLRSIYHGIYPFLLGKYPGIYFFRAYPGIYTFNVNT